MSSPNPAFSPEHEALLATVPAPTGSAITAVDVAYDHDGYALEGYLAHDTAISGPKPAVVIVHNWLGLQEYSKVRAQMLARLGYAAFAIDVYGTGIRPGADTAASLAGQYYGDLPLLRARVAAGLARAKADPAIDPDRVVVMGYCFGGSASIELARTGAEASGFASFHGRLVVHEPAEVSAIAAPLLIMTGGSDPVVPDADIVAFQDELRTEPSVDWELVTYAGAPHAFTQPADHAMYREGADRRSWARFLQFLDEVFAEQRATRPAEGAPLDPQTS